MKVEGHRSGWESEWRSVVTLVILTRSLAFLGQGQRFAWRKTGQSGVPPMAFDHEGQRPGRPCFAQRSALGHVWIIKAKKGQTPRSPYHRISKSRFGPPLARITNLRVTNLTRCNDYIVIKVTKGQSHGSATQKNFKVFRLQCNRLG